MKGKKIRLLTCFVMAIMLITLTACEKMPIKVDNTSKSTSEKKSDMVELERNKGAKLSDGTVCRLTETPWIYDEMLYVSYEIKNPGKKAVKVDSYSTISMYADYQAMESGYEDMPYEDSEILLKPGKKLSDIAAFYHPQDFKIIEVFVENYYWTFKVDEIEVYNEDNEPEEGDPSEWDSEPKIEDVSAYSDTEICELALDYYERKYQYRPQVANVDNADEDWVTVHLYDDVDDHTATSAIYTINRYSLWGTDVINSEDVDLNLKG